MGAETAISWTDHTFNPWEGCTKVSPGCAHCYAETRNARFGGGKAPNWGPGAPRRRTSANNWKQPLSWDAAAAKLQREITSGSTPYIGEPYRRPRVFCASLADWLDDEVPVAWRAELLALIKETPHLDWLLLTKRPESWRERMGEVVGMTMDEGAKAVDQCSGAALAAAWLNGAAPANVWLGTTVEDQERANERIPHLLRIPASVRFLSCEPLLGHVWLRIDMPGGSLRYNVLRPYRPIGSTAPEQPHVDWVICGGESGPGARPMHPEWARALRDQCAGAGVAFHFKQWGGGKKREAGRLLDGVEHNAFPEVQS